MKVRLIFSKNIYLTFTPRGKQNHSHYIPGFVRLDGRTVSGLAYNNGPELVFDPRGKHENYATEQAFSERGWKSFKEAV